jgi:hypothetical protein
MDDLDRRIQAAYRALTDRSDLDGILDAVAAVSPTRDRPRPRSVAARVAALVAAGLVVAGSAASFALVASRPGLTAPPTQSSVDGGTPRATVTSAPSAMPQLVWHRQPLDGPPAGPGTMIAVTAGGPGLVAVGWATDMSHHHNTPTSERHHTEAVAWRSPDGAIWWRVDGQPGFEHAVIQDVAWSGGVLVAVGYDDSDPGGARTTRIWMSRDGGAWTVLPQDTIPPKTRLNAVMGTANGFLAAGAATTDDGRDDGATWAPATGDDAAFGDTALSDIVDTGAGLIGLATVPADPSGSRPALWRSDIGTQWASIALADDAFGSDVAAVAQIIAGGPGYIAVGTTIDTTSPQDPVSTLLWPPTDGAIWTSQDLRTWERVEPGRAMFGGETQEAISSVLAVRDGFLAFGMAGGGAAGWSSVDGRRWERIDLPDARDGAIAGAVVMNGRVLGVGGIADGPAVWSGRLENAANSPRAAANREFPITVYTHCGLDRSRFDFDGSFWRAIGETSDGQGNPPPGYDNPYDAGTIRVLDDGTALYTSSQGYRLRLERAASPGDGC